MKTWRLATVACGALLVLTGCRDRSTAQSDQDKLCSEVAQLDGSVAQLAALEPSAASVARVKELRLQIEKQYKDVQDAAKDASGINIQPLTQAYNNVLRSINGVNDQDSLARAEPQIDQAAGEFSTARTDLHSAAHC